MVFSNMATYMHHSAFGFPSSSIYSISNTSFWIFIMCQEALGRPGDVAGSTIGMIAALLTLPLRVAEIPGLEWLSPYLQIRSASSVPHSSFCCHCRLIAQARELGVSCRTSPFPSSLTSDPPAGLGRGTSEVEPFWTTFLHLTDVILLLPVATASQLHVSFLCRSLSSRGQHEWGPRPVAAASPGNLLAMRVLGPLPGLLRQTLQGWSPTSLIF